MKKARVVIGANHGDEGKGLVTDYLCSKTGSETVVVRFNGGAQAGHTVTCPDGRRHVFSHFGSGSFLGCPTYLSRFFVCNPLVFFRERKELNKKEVSPVVYIDPMALITTPYDMMINQCIEELRGQKRHGSCGLGFGETIERNLRPVFSITFSDLFMPDSLRSKLEAIRSSWVSMRLAKLGLNDIPDVWKVTFESPHVIDRFMNDIEIFLQQVICAPAGLLRHTKNIVFEGAQGLLLDQDAGSFPHVTRSNTGLKNVSMLANECGISALQVHYLTRSYMTRHGAGPLAHEISQPLYSKIVDLTNRPNKFQGSLRFAPLDLDILSQSIREDLKYCSSTMAIDPVLFVGCMDQIDQVAQYVLNGKLCGSTSGSFLDALQKKTGLASMLTSYGPSRNDVRASYGYDRSEWQVDPTSNVKKVFHDELRVMCGSAVTCRA